MRFNTDADGYQDALQERNNDRKHEKALADERRYPERMDEGAYSAERVRRIAREMGARVDLIKGAP